MSLSSYRNLSSTQLDIASKSFHNILESTHRPQATHTNNRQRAAKVWRAFLLPSYNTLTSGQSGSGPDVNNNTAWGLMGGWWGWKMKLEDGRACWQVANVWPWKATGMPYVNGQ